jgi:hypothetical protein
MMATQHHPRFRRSSLLCCAPSSRSSRAVVLLARSGPTAPAPATGDTMAGWFGQAFVVLRT